MSLTVARALSILGLLSHDRSEVSVTELSHELGVSKSIIHRLVRTLEHHGFLERNSVTRRYRMGLGAFRVGSLFLDGRALESEALPIMRDLVSRTGHSSQLGILNGDVMVITAAIEGPGPIKYSVPMGDYRLGHTSAMGKAGLAQLSDTEVDAILARRGMQRRTRYSITDPDVLKTQLREVRACGYAVNWEENHLGVGSVAAPVRTPKSDLVAAISLGFPTQLIRRPDMRRLGEIVRDAAARLSRRLFDAPDDTIRQAHDNRAKGGGSRRSGRRQASSPGRRQ
jgi:DNA-binding IclR family transcriptional regulator